MSTRAMVDPRLFYRGPQNWGYGDLGRGIGAGLSALGGSIGAMLANRRQMEADGWMRQEEVDAWKRKKQAEAEAEQRNALAASPTMVPNVKNPQVEVPYGAYAQGNMGMKMPSSAGRKSSLDGAFDVTAPAPKVQLPTKTSYVPQAKNSAQQAADQRLMGTMSAGKLLGTMLQAELPTARTDIFSGRRVHAGPLQERVQAFQELIAAGTNPREAHAIVSGPQALKGYLEGEKLQSLEDRVTAIQDAQTTRTGMTVSGANQRMQLRTDTDRDIASMRTASAEGIANANRQARMDQLKYEWGQRRAMAREEMAGATERLQAQAVNDKVLQSALATVKMELDQEDQAISNAFEVEKYVADTEDSMRAQWANEDDVAAAGAGMRARFGNVPSPEELIRRSQGKTIEQRINEAYGRISMLERGRNQQPTGRATTPTPGGRTRPTSPPINQ